MAVFRFRLNNLLKLSKVSLYLTLFNLQGTSHTASVQHPKTAFALFLSPASRSACLLYHTRAPLSSAFFGFFQIFFRIRKYPNPRVMRCDGFYAIFRQLSRLFCKNWKIFSGGLRSRGVILRTHLCFLAYHCKRGSAAAIRIPAKKRYLARMHRRVRV